MRPELLLVSNSSLSLSATAPADHPHNTGNLSTCLMVKESVIFQTKTLGKSSAASSCGELGGRPILGLLCPQHGVWQKVSSPDISDISQACLVLDSTIFDPCTVPLTESLITGI